MMGAEAPETCWATQKRQVMNLWNCCIQLVNLFELYDDARTCQRQMHNNVFVSFTSYKDRGLVIIELVLYNPCVLCHLSFVIKEYCTFEEWIDIQHFFYRGYPVVFNIQSKQIVYSCCCCSHKQQHSKCTRICIASQH